MAMTMPWEELKEAMKKEFCPEHELQRLETEFWEIQQMGIRKYIRGLPMIFRDAVVIRDPHSIEEAIALAASLSDDHVRDGTLSRKDESSIDEKAIALVSSILGAIGILFSKVSPWKEVVRFRKKGKLSPRFVGPFEILDKIGPVAYRLKLPTELSNVHPVFHVSNLKRCLDEGNLQVTLDGVRIDDTMHFVARPVEIMDHKDKFTKTSRIPLVKVRWESKQGVKFTWECKDQRKTKYPHLFATVNSLILGRNSQK
ncbi:uncharacterized protein LOC143634062 [Bidens hawaiensis]|uniref:uncharacterized protein LOC143634062 n=1 Tax=Bidens hawaiensis TaxID=980011 RepID=UPI00404A6488